MTAARLALGLVALLVFAGCAGPLGGDPTRAGSPTPSPTPSARADATPTPTPSPTPTPTPSPTVTERPPEPATPTPADPEVYPPGVSPSGVSNATAVVDAHQRALNRTGYVAVGQGETAVLRNGFLVGVTTEARTVVAAGSTRYYEVRHISAGPVSRRAQRYSNGSVERLRRTENGQVTLQRQPPRPPSVLASVELLEPLLAGGDFNVTAVRADANPTAVVLRANRTDDVSALMASLPEKTERVRSYEATTVVDSTGRVRSLNATAEFVIAGRNRTHRVQYAVESLGVWNVSTPDWVDPTNASNVSSVRPARPGQVTAVASSSPPAGAGRSRPPRCP